MMIPANGRSKRSGVNVSGTNNGNRLFAMNKIVMNGTPRTNSMNTTLAKRTAGSGERRPSARNTPSGKEKTKPKRAAQKNERQNRIDDKKQKSTPGSPRRLNPQQPDYHSGPDGLRQI